MLSTITIYHRLSTIGYLLKIMAIRIFCTIGAAFLLIGVALPQLLYPLWFDQGAFAACADIIRRGGVMYRDCWEVRGPLLPLLLTLPRSLSSSAATIHAFELMWQALTALTLGLLARRMFGRLAAFIAPTLYWLMFASLNYWATVQAEGFANLFFVLALLSLTHKHRFAPVLAGLCCGLLFWFKYPFAIFILLLFVAKPHLTTLQSPIQNLKSKILLGLILPITFGLIYFALNGALTDWWLHVQYDIATFNNVPLAHRWEWLTGLFWVEIKAFVSHGNTPTAGWKATVLQWDILGRGYPFIFGLMGLGLLRGLRSSQYRRPALIALAYLAIVVGLNIWQGHSYRYHFVIWLPAMALLASAAALPITTPHPKAWVQLQMGSVFGLTCLACLGMVAAMWPWLRDAYDNVVIQRKPIAQTVSESALADYDNLARFVRDNTSPNDSIFIYSDVPALYALAERPNAARFPYMRWVDEAGDDEIRERYTAQLLTDLQRTRPKFFILSRDGFPWPEAKFIESWKRQKSVNDWVEANYAYSGENGPFLVFARK